MSVGSDFQKIKTEAGYQDSKIFCCKSKILYSSFHFLLHYPYIAPIYCIVVSILSSMISI